MRAGDKVICIDDAPRTLDPRTKGLARNVVYTVEGHSLCRRGFNVREIPCDSNQFFYADRFISLTAMG